MEGKIALITGAATGIGAATARLFAQEGAKVVVTTDKRVETGSKVVSEINSMGGSAIFVRLDVSSEDDWKAAIKTAVSTFGGLTTLVNNAGIFHLVDVESETMEGWNKIISVNQAGVFLGMKTAMPELLKSGNASIVNIASEAALKGLFNGMLFSYQASKGAVRMMTKAAAVGYATRGVRVNTVFPGNILTPINEDVSPEDMKAALACVPMGTAGDPQDLAYGVLYLASDEARYVTGAELAIDGGWSAT